MAFMSANATPVMSIRSTTGLETFVAVVGTLEITSFVKSVALTENTLEVDLSSDKLITNLLAGKRDVVPMSLALSLIHI